MGGSSISADVKAANSKLAQMLRKREEDEAILQIGKRKIKDQAREERERDKSKTGGQRYREPADFSYPSPLVDRPRTEAGSTSFHFAFTSISKEGSPTYNGKTIKGFGGAHKTPGADHAGYIERDGAAEVTVGTHHANYIERDGAVEISAVEIDPFTGLITRDTDEVGETPSAEEASVLGPVDWAAKQSIFTNISNDKFEREEYWRAVHRTEREAKIHSLIVDPSSSPQWWESLEAWTNVPDNLRHFQQHCLKQQDRYRAWLAEQAAKPSNKPFIAEPYKRTADGCGDAIIAAKNLKGWNLVHPPLEFKSGRGGRVQFRFVAELPHEVTAEDRALITHNLCQHLASLSKDADGNPTGMMYTAVIHAPDAHNDKRNYHLHIIAHDRPAKWMPEHQAWDFEIPEVYQDPGSRKLRTRYPYRQNKIGEVSQGSSKTGSADSGIDFIPALRRKFAQINNAVLEARGIQRRLDPRTYAKMGIDRTPTEHLGTKAAALEAIGVPTVVGKLNAIAIWNDAERSIRTRAASVNAKLKSTQKDLSAFVDDAMIADLHSANTRNLRLLAAERERLVQNIADDRLELMIFDHLEAKAKSRAFRTRQSCLQILTEADRIPGSHSKAEVKAIKKRYQEAQDHLEKVDAELLQDRPRLKTAAEDVLTREARIREIDEQIFILRASLIDKVDAARAAPDYKQQLDALARRTPRTSLIQPAQPVQPTEPANDDDVNQVESSAATQAISGRLYADDRQAEERRPLSAAKTEGILSSSELAPQSHTLHLPAPPLPSQEGVSVTNLMREVRTDPGLPLNLQDVHLSHQLRPNQGPGSELRRPRTGDRAVDQSSQALDKRNQDTPAPVMAPPAVQGVPIIQPTLAGLPDAITPLRKASEETPEGLAPVTPSTPEPIPSKLPTVEFNIGEENTTTAADNSTSAGATKPEATQPQADSADQKSAGQPPTKSKEGGDKRKIMTDPTLFPVEESKAPTKSGSSKANLDEWDALINRISSQRIPVEKEADQSKPVTYVVPSLSKEDQALLQSPRFAARTTGRLAAIENTQQYEIDRLVRWISKSGRDPGMLIIADRTAKIGKAPDSVKTLFRNWRTHARVLNAVRAENDRRTVREKVQERIKATPVEKAKPTQPTKADRDKATRLRELEAKFPTPEAAFTPQVGTLIELLRNDAPEEEIQKAAEAVAADPFAREDVYKHSVELANAYNNAIDDDLAGILLRMQWYKGNSR